MVRRLKEDLRKLGVDQFPKRTLVSLEVGDAASPELVLARQLAEYTALTKPERGHGALVFINLQKRLLSGVEAFYRTLQAHHRAVAEGRAKTAVQLPILAAIGVSGIVGLWHGLLVTRLRIPPFIATLSGFLAYRGLALLLSDARGLSPMSAECQT